MLYLFGMLIAKPIIWLLFRPKVIGLKNLFCRGKAILVSNHWSLWDPVLLAAISPRVVRFMAKQELFTSKLKRFFFKTLYVFPVNRGHADIASLKYAMSLLEKGKMFGIFPEGKRSVTGELDELERGAAFLALRCNAHIIPIYSSPDAFRKVRIRMIVGAPMDAQAIAAERKGKSTEVVTEAVRERLLELKAEMEART